MKTGLIVMAVVVAALAPAWGQEESAPAPEVWIGFTLHEVDLDHTGIQDSAFIRAHIDIDWKPMDLPDFDPAGIQVFNGIGTPTIRPIAPRDSDEAPLPGYERRSYLIVGIFKAYNDYTDFPFDDHELGLIFYIPGRNPDDVRFAAAEEDLQLRIAFPALTNGWSIQFMGFHPTGAGFRHSLPSTNRHEPDAVFGIVIRIDRQLSAHLVRIIFPMVLIWGLSYMGFYWKDSSPASRFGGSALLAAVALSLGVGQFIPKSGYLMAINVAFLGLYTCIAINSLLTAFIFAAKDRGHPELAENIRRFAWFLAPALAVVVAVVFVLVAQRTVRDSFFDLHPPVSAEF